MEQNFISNSRLIVKLEKLDTHMKAKRKWLHSFIHRYHSTPKHILPSLSDLTLRTHVYFRAVGTRGITHGQVVGITSYEIRTRFLAETQKTIVLPKYRSKGFGKAISVAIERELKKTGFKKIRTTIYFDNLPMLAIKLEQGYVIEGYHPDHEAPGLHEYSLGKVLG
ncbi:MAG: GNAT family N-acetyltransferase [Bdellovibrionota bacterium]